MKQVTYAGHYDFIGEQRFQLGPGEQLHLQGGRFEVNLTEPVAVHVDVLVYNKSRMNEKQFD